MTGVKIEPRHCCLGCSSYIIGNTGHCMRIGKDVTFTKDKCASDDTAIECPLDNLVKD